MDGTFSRVDASRDPAALAGYLDGAAELPFFRPGGRVAALEPDWSALEIVGGDPDLAATLLGARLRSIPCPTAGARLSRLLADAGFAAVRSRPMPLVASGPAALHGLRFDAYA